MKYKLITVVGTRPEIIRLSEIIKKLDENFNHIKPGPILSSPF